MKYYENKLGYLLCTELTVNTALLDQVNVIDSQDEAENLFRETNEIPANESVFIPAIIIDKETDTLLAEQLDTLLQEVDTTIEQYINEYTV